jgi:hypothetical protein
MFCLQISFIKIERAGNTIEQSLFLPRGSGTLFAKVVCTYYFTHLYISDPFQ